MPFSDDFNRGSLGANWTTNGSGTTDLSSNRLRQYGGSNYFSAIATGGSSLTDQTVQATITKNTHAGCGLLARANSGGTTGYLAFIDDGGVSGGLYKVTAGPSFSLIGSTWSQTVNTGDVISIVCSGTSIAMKINGTTVASGTDSTHTTGYGGVYSYFGYTTANCSSWDDFYQGLNYTPSNGTLGSVSFDEHGRASMTYTEGATAPDSLKVYRSANNSTFVDISSNCVITDNGSTWSIVDKNPSYGSQAITLNSTAYYKVRAYGGLTAAAADTSTVSGTYALTKSTTELAVWAALRAFLNADVATRCGWSTGRYLGAAAYVAATYPAKTSEALSDFSSWWTQAKAQLDSNNYFIPTDVNDLLRPAHNHELIAYGLASARIFRAYLPSDSTAQTLAADLSSTLDSVGVALMNLSTYGSARTGYGATWPTVAGATAWAATTTYNVGTIRKPTSGSPARIYRQISPTGGTFAGTSYGISAASEPTWPNTDRGIVTDGSCVWVECTNDIKTWQASTAIPLGQIRYPTTRNSHTYRCIQAGTTHASTEPTWPTTTNGQVPDGTVVWEETSSPSSVALLDWEYNKTTYARSHAFTMDTIGDNLGRCAAAFGFLLTDTNCTNFKSGGSKRAAAITMVQDNLAVGATLQVGTGAIIQQPDRPFYDTGYASFTLNLYGAAYKNVSSLLTSRDNAMVEAALDWFDRDYGAMTGASSGWSTTGTTGSVTAGSQPYSVELIWRYPAYRMRGRTMPNIDLAYTSRMHPSIYDTETGQAAGSEDASIFLSSLAFPLAFIQLQTCSASVTTTPVLTKQTTTAKSASVTSTASKTVARTKTLSASVTLTPAKVGSVSATRAASVTTTPILTKQIHKAWNADTAIISEIIKKTNKSLSSPTTLIPALFRVNVEEWVDPFNNTTLDPSWTDYGSAIVGGGIVTFDNDATRNVSSLEGGEIIVNINTFYPYENEISFGVDPWGNTHVSLRKADFFEWYSVNDSGSTTHSGYTTQEYTWFRIGISNGSIRIRGSFDGLSWTTLDQFTSSGSTWTQPGVFGAKVNSGVAPLSLKGAAYVAYDSNTPPELLAWDETGSISSTITVSGETNDETGFLNNSIILSGSDTYSTATTYIESTIIDVASIISGADGYEAGFIESGALNVVSTSSGVDSYNVFNESGLINSSITVSGTDAFYSTSYTFNEFGSIGQVSTASSADDYIIYVPESHDELGSLDVLSVLSGEDHFGDSQPVNLEVVIGVTGEFSASRRLATRIKRHFLRG